DSGCRRMARYEALHVNLAPTGFTGAVSDPFCIRREVGVRLVRRRHQERNRLSVSRHWHNPQVLLLGGVLVVHDVATIERPVVRMLDGCRLHQGLRSSGAVSRLYVNIAERAAGPVSECHAAIRRDSETAIILYLARVHPAEDTTSRITAHKMLA